MSSQRKIRAEKRADNQDPINVTIVTEDGGRKVLTWKEYQKHLIVKLKPEEN